MKKGKDGRGQCSQTGCIFPEKSGRALLTCFHSVNGPTGPLHWYPSHIPDTSEQYLRKGNSVMSKESICTEGSQLQC